jgi:hypothetical protein
MIRTIIIPLFHIFCCLPLAFAIDEESGFDYPELPQGWTLFDPLGTAEITSDTGTLGLHVPAPTLETALLKGPARAAILTAEIRETTQAVAEVTVWPIATDREVDGGFVGVVTRGRGAFGGDSETGPFPGVVSRGVDGYSLSFIDLGNGYARLQLHRLANEQAVLIADPVDFSVSAITKIGLALSSRGDRHYGAARNLTPGAESPFPIAAISARDETYPHGRAGVLVVTDRLTSVSAGFDHLLVWDGRLPQPSIRRAPTGDWVELVVDHRRATACRLECRYDLADPDDPWITTAPHGWTYQGPQIILRYPFVYPKRFFRLASE